MTDCLIVVTRKRSKPSDVPTLQTVAERAGVSKVTVSHILGGKEADRYSEETRRKVYAAAESLHYFPNRAAQVMRKGKSNQIGVIHFGMQYEVARDSIQHISQSIAERGYDVLVTDLSWQGGDYQRVVEQLIQLRVEGVVISQTVEAFGAKEVSILKRYGIPVVTVAGNETLGVPAIFGDVAKGFEELTRHVLGLGHKKLMLITSQYDRRPALSRIQGFKNGLQSVGGVLDTEQRDVHAWLASSRQEVIGKVVRLKTQFPNAIYYYVRQLIADKALPDVLICSNDTWARQTFSACLENGLSIPDDVAITGYDNDDFGEFAPYYLTTVDDLRKDQCELAIQILVDMINGKNVPVAQHVLPVRPIIRRSCGSTATPLPTERAGQFYIKQ